MLVASIPSSGVEPHGISSSPDNSTVYVVNEHSDSVDIIDTATRTRVDTLPVGQEGQALVHVAGAGAAGPRHVEVTVRGVKGLDMVQLQGAGLTPSTTYTAYAARGNDQVPLASFTTDAQGAAPQVLAFVKFLGVYDITQVQVRPGQ